MFPVPQIFDSRFYRLIFCSPLLLLLVFAGVSSSLASSAGERAVNEPSSRTELQYKAATDYYYRLNRDPATSSDRTNWLNGIRNFRRIYLADQQGALSPSCLYMMARMYRQTYQHFNLPIDIEESIAYFTELVSTYPNNSLADDALFNLAQIELTDKGNPLNASKIYEQLVQRYPDSDKTPQAAGKLRELTKKYPIKPSENLTTAQNALPLITIQPLQHWSSNNYTRIVIRASSPAHYKARLLEKNNNQPRRLCIDLNRSSIPPGSEAPIPIQNGLLKQARTVQLDKHTVRVILDLETISDYKIFSLKDPFRVVIDIHGIKKEKGNEAPALTKEPVIQPPAEKKQPPLLQTTVQLRNKPEILPILKDRKKVSPVVTTKQETASTQVNRLSLAQQLGLGVRRIVIDPGHGGKDPGAMAHGLKEKDIVLNVAHRTSTILEKKYNYDVILTRDRDIYLPLEERTAIANTSNADLFVAIHVNAHPKTTTKGIETFYLNLATNTEAMRVAARENATSTHNISELQDILSDLMQNAKIKESSQLAEFVQTSLITGLRKHNYQSKDLGVKQAPFYVLIGAEMPAILAEISFISNPDEAKLLKDSNYLQTLAEQIAAGIANFVEYRRTAALQL